MSAVHSSFRTFAALLLLVGLLLGGAVDAVACEPEFHPTSFVEVQADQQDGNTSEQGTVDDEACVHGHCHHCAQTLVKNHDVATVMFVANTPSAVDQTSLVPIVGNTLKRPPRA